MAFEYKQLDEPRTYIRVLALKPAQNHTGDLKAHLFHVPLASAKYEALSYAWGDATVNQGRLAIQYQQGLDFNDAVDARMISIGDNLVLALQHLRCKDEMRYLWVDAISINQQNDYEKSKQVQMMGSIYSRAQQVVCWLGLGTPGSNHAMTMVGKIGAEFRKAYSTMSKTKFEDWLEECSLGWGWGPLFVWFRCEYLKDANEYPAFSLADMMDSLKPRKRFKDPISPEGCLDFFGADMITSLRPLFLDLLDQFYFTGDELFKNGLNDLFHKTYWSRIWILQELFARSEANKPPLLICGQHSIVLIDLFIVTDFLNNTFTLVCDLLSRLERLDNMRDFDVRPPRISWWFRLFPSVVGGSLPALYRVAHFARSAEGSTDLDFKICQATDPRDLVYGLLSVIDGNLNLLPDYSKSVEQVFIDTTLAYLKLNNLTILEAAYLKGRSQSHLPSWVVDWSSSPVYFTNNTYGQIGTIPASFDISEVEVAYNGNVSRMTCLSIKGISVDRVKSVIPALIDHVPKDENGFANQEKRSPYLKMQLIGLQQALSNLSKEDTITTIEKAGYAAFKNKATSRRDFQVRLKREYDALGLWQGFQEFVLDRFRTHHAAEDFFADDMITQLVRSDLIVFESGFCAFHKLHRDRFVQSGDELVRFYGSSMPFVLKDVEGTEESLLVCPMPIEGLDEDHFIDDVGAQKVFRLI